MNRQDILKKGIELTDGSRNETYGDMVENMNKMAKLLDVLLPDKAPWTGADCCTVLMANKLARELNTPDSRYSHEDNAVDGCVYWAARYECADAGPKNFSWGTELQENLPELNAELNQFLEAQRDPVDKVAKMKECFESLCAMDSNYVDYLSPYGKELLRLNAKQGD